MCTQNRVPKADCLVVCIGSDEVLAPIWQREGYMEKVRLQANNSKLTAQQFKVRKTLCSCYDRSGSFCFDSAIGCFDSDIGQMLQTCVIDSEVTLLMPPGLEKLESSGEGHMCPGVQD